MLYPIFFFRVWLNLVFLRTSCALFWFLLLPPMSLSEPWVHTFCPASLITSRSMRKAGTGSSRPCWHGGSHDGQLESRSPLLSDDDDEGGMDTGLSLSHSTGSRADQRCRVHRVHGVPACLALPVPRLRSAPQHSPAHQLWQGEDTGGQPDRSLCCPDQGQWWYPALEIRSWSVRRCCSCWRRMVMGTCCNQEIW